MASSAPGSTAPQADEFPFLTQLERRIGRLLDLVAVLKQERQRLERENAVLLQEQALALRDKTIALEEKSNVIKELAETRATLAVSEAVANEAKAAVAQGVSPVELEKVRAEANAAMRHADEAQTAARKWAEQVELAKAEISRLNDAIARMKIDRQQVRERIEKVLGQMDTITPTN
jgi:chromosome segregation ATPase